MSVFKCHFTQYRKVSFITKLAFHPHKLNLHSSNSLTDSNSPSALICTTRIYYFHYLPWNIHETSSNRRSSEHLGPMALNNFLFSQKHYNHNPATEALTHELLPYKHPHLMTDKPRLSFITTIAIPQPLHIQCDIPRQPHAYMHTHSIFHRLPHALNIHTSTCSALSCALTSIFSQHPTNPLCSSAP